MNMHSCARRCGQTLHTPGTGVAEKPFAARCKGLRDRSVSGSLPQGSVPVRPIRSVIPERWPAGAGPTRVAGGLCRGLSAYSSLLCNSIESLLRSPVSWHAERRGIGRAALLPSAFRLSAVPGRGCSPFPGTSLTRHICDLRLCPPAENLRRFGNCRGGFGRAATRGGSLLGLLRVSDCCGGGWGGGFGRSLRRSFRHCALHTPLIAFYQRVKQHPKQFMIFWHIFNTSLTSGTNDPIWIRYIICTAIR